MAAPQIFKVLTEFRFEIGSAVAQSNKLTSAVDGISEAADRTLLNFQRLSFGIISNFLSGPGGGILGVLFTAIQASDTFAQSQIGLANVLGRQAGSFAERMDFAARKMAEINRIAKDFALPSKDLVNITKVLTPVLRQKLSPTAAINKSIELGRFFLKAAPTLNVDPGLAIGQLQRAVLGFASAGDPLFRILTADTKAMNEFVGQSKLFNKLPLAERVQKLVLAFKEFGNDAKVLAAITNSVSGQMRIIKEQFAGMFSVLRPLGDVLASLAVDVLKKLNLFISNVVRPVFADLAFAIAPFLSNSKELLITLLQLSNLRSDVALASNILLVSGAILGISAALSFFGLQIAIISPIINAMAGFIGFLSVSMGSLLGPTAGILGFFNGLFILVTALIAPLLLLVFVFQLMSRIAAIIRVEAAERLVGFATLISAVGRNLSRLFAIFLDGFNKLAQAFATSPAVEFGFFVLEQMISALDTLVNIAIFATAGFQGLAFAILEFLNQISSFVTGGGFAGGAIGKAFDAGQEDIFEKVFGRIKDGEAISQSTININRVEIRNEFKEKIEPDRVAFTIKETLLKAAQNPTGAAGRPFSLSGVNR